MKESYSSRLEALEKKVDEHIHDGIDVWKSLEQVKSDLQWIKKAFWLSVSLGVAINGFLLKYAFFNTFVHNVWHQ